MDMEQVDEGVVTTHTVSKEEAAVMEKLCNELFEQIMKTLPTPERIMDCGALLLCGMARHYGVPKELVLMNVAHLYDQMHSNVQVQAVN